MGPRGRALAPVMVREVSEVRRTRVVGKRVGTAGAVRELSTTLLKGNKCPISKRHPHGIHQPTVVPTS